VNQIDAAVLTLVLLFAYKGWRTGFVGVALGLTGGLLAFGLSAVLAPLLAPTVTPLVAERFGVPGALVRPALVVGLTVALRFVLGLAVRELAGVLRLAIRGVPPLALADRLLGVLPSAALGAALALALVLVALQLPHDVAGYRPVEDSWTVRNVVNRPGETVARLRAAGERLLTDPPRVNGFALGLGAAGLALAGFTVARLGGAPRAADFHEAPTRRSRRPAPAAVAEAGDPLALARLILGLGVALAMMAALVLLSAAR
jgi:uncharacterized membrane protein required for colicin V production